jgi:hypothetical protein
MISNEKRLSYKVVYLVKSYNVHIRLPPSEFRKKLQFFENEPILTAVSTTFAGITVAPGTILKRRVA